MARHGGHDEEFSTSADCFNHDRPFLVTLAWCLHLHCEKSEGTELWQLERFWETDAVPEAHHAPNYTYTEALAQLDDEGPKAHFYRGREMKEPSAVSAKDVAPFQTYLDDFARTETQHSRYGIFLFFVMLLAPLALALVQTLIFAASRDLERKVLAHLIEPAIWGRRHLVSLPYDIGMAPLRGQALFISFTVLLNLVLSVVRYKGSIPNSNYENESDAFWTYFSNRAGYLSFANLAVVFLYSGRNNPLIRLSGWSYGTFVLLHRWIAYICITQASVHSLIKLIKHIPYFSKMFVKLYWNIGFGAFMVFIAMFATSILPFRRRWYQTFLDIHNVLAVGAVLLCFFHVYVEFGYSWGYENWIVLSAVIWSLERVVRLVKVARHGVRTAVITPLDGEYCEVTIDGAAETGYVYLYFPRRWWRIWENHPFSVASAVDTSKSGTSSYTKPQEAGDTMFEVGSDDESDRDVHEWQGAADDAPHETLARKPEDLRLMPLPPRLEDGALPNTPSSLREDDRLLPDEEADRDMGSDGDDTVLIRGDRSAAARLSFLVRRQRGLTNRLFRSQQSQKVLIEGPYASISTSASLATASPQVICIVGGSGITAVLPLLRSRASSASGRTVLYWSCRSEALVEISAVRQFGTFIESHILVGRRWDVEDVVSRETGGIHGDVVVVTCGPVSMADDVRHAVVEANKRRSGKGIIRLYEECYSW
ncbi:ferric reductase like transmembrane component domain-containing protein [Sarocladium implicatum]|nr:ferric reductase like transmembrane component domain-containing protein [Sarocladium implicatum]